ncbi:MAG: 1-acyl-sn-glycerol-3-phosphate acyltransferase [Thermoanaerobaculia bacterium]|nr:1-acyl-sn-glycerol-3-phosphate acyltransferase [Thermoanaerobaculia bacterium]
MRSYVAYALLRTIKFLSSLFYTLESDWVGDPPEDRWEGIRLVVFLNHTSLFEPLYAMVCPNGFLKRIGWNGVVPAADKTLRRPLVGWLFRFVARHVVSITRERDHTWHAVLERIGEDSMVIILPEGRMMRRNGLDSHGRPMTVRGGIADILREIDEGRMLVAYSGGLHHVQAPGEWRVGVFKTIRIRLELLEVSEYRQELDGDSLSHDEFKSRVKEDLEKRRDLHCPRTPETSPL